MTSLSFWLRYTVARANRAPFSFSFSFFFSKKTQEILDAIKKIHGYVYAIKKFGDMCMPSHELFFTCIPFWMKGGLTEANGDGKGQFCPSAFSGALWTPRVLVSASMPKDNELR